MGVKFGREYDDIIFDLGEAISRIRGFYSFFDMSSEDWDSMNEVEQQECIKTLADDVFFALGKDEQLVLSEGSIQYIKQKHIITVEDGDNVVTVVNLT